MAHGLDQFFTGMSAVFTGRLEDSVTSQLLQETGLSPYAAGLIDSSLSTAGSMGGIATIQASRYRVHNSCVGAYVSSRLDTKRHRNS